MTRIETRNCSRCGEPFKQREQESYPRFLKRRFCSLSCSTANRNAVVAVGRQQVCKSPDCNDAVHAQGLCNYGYARLLRGTYDGSCARTIQVCSAWMLPDDGIVDELAVEIAARGIRVVRLTRTEAVLAIRRMLAQRLTMRLIAERVGCSPDFVENVAKGSTEAAAA